MRKWCTRFLCLGLLTGHALGAEFSADRVMTMPDMMNQGQARTMSGKIYVKGDMVRAEHEMMGRKSIIIFNATTNKMLNLDPQRKLCIESEGVNFQAVGGGAPLVESEEYWKEIGATKKPIGTEDIGEYSCEKYAITYEDESRGEGTLWSSPKLGTWIRFVSKNKIGTSTMELKNIKEEPLDDSLFQVPADYKRVSVDNVIEGMGFGGRP